MPRRTCYSGETHPSSTRERGSVVGFTAVSKRAPPAEHAARIDRAEESATGDLWLAHSPACSMLPSPARQDGGPEAAPLSWRVDRRTTNGGRSTKHPATRTGCLRRMLRVWWLRHRDLSLGCVEKVHIELFRAGDRLKVDKREADFIDRIVR
jgi:hypothetical protein